MSDRLKALREARVKIVGDMRAITDKAESEKRDLTNEEAAQHKTLFDEAEAKRQSMEALERQTEVERDQATRTAEDEEIERRTRDGTIDKAAPETREAVAFRKFLSQGLRALTDEEQRALSAGANDEGGYLVPPAQFIAQLLKGVDNAVHIRTKATKFTLTQAETLGIPTLDVDLADADWTTELATGNEDTSIRFGKRELRPHPMAKRIKISKKLLRASALPIEAIIRQRIEYKVGVTQEKGYMIGTGNQQPLGMFVASADGIPTTRDVSTGNDTTKPTFDGLIGAKYSLKAQYMNTAEWLFHRDTMREIAKLKDGDGQYIWKESVRDGEPDRILGRPVTMNEYVPNTLTTGQYVGLFGDFSYYWIVDCLDLQIQRLLELYAETNQDGFIARYEGDGMPVLAEAFARVKLG